MFNFDSQIHFSDLLVFGGGTYAFLKVFLGARDNQRDTTFTLKAVNRLLELHGLKLDAQDKTLVEHNDRLNRHDYVLEERRKTPRRQATIT